MASGPPNINRTDNQRDSEKPYRQDHISHYNAIGRSIEKIIHRSENVKFKEDCMGLLGIKSVPNRTTVQSQLAAMVKGNRPKK